MYPFGMKLNVKVKIIFMSWSQIEFRFQENCELSYIPFDLAKQRKFHFLFTKTMKTCISVF